MKSIRIVSLLLAALMCLFLFACGDGQGSGDENNNNNGNGADTEDELFAELKAAWVASGEYEGPLTVKMRQVFGEDGQDRVGDSMISVDVKNGKFLEINVYGDEKMVKKAFAEDDSFYLYEDYGEEGSYTKYTNGIDGVYNIEKYNMKYLLEMMMPGATVADSYTELKAALDELCPKLVENEIAYMTAEGAFKEDSSASLAPASSITRAEDGTVILDVTYDIAILDIVTEYTESVKMKASYTIAAKDGMVTGIGMSVEGEDTVVLDGKETVYNQKACIDYSFEYKFDDAEYNKIEVSAPADADVEVNDSGDLWKFEIILGNVSVPGNVSSGISADQADTVFRGSVYLRADRDSDKIELKGFYADEAMTRRIDASMTNAELVALEKIYADFEVAEGYCLFKRDSSTEDLISRKYKMLAFPLLFSVGYADTIELVRPAGQTVDLSYETAGGEDHKVLINGEETDLGSFVTESGKTYLVEFVTLLQDKDLGISYIISLS